MKFLKAWSIRDLYEFMSNQKESLPNKDLIKSIKNYLIYEKLKTKQDFNVYDQECITFAAVNNRDPICKETIDFFIQLLGCLL